MVTVAVYTIVLLILHFANFFSLFFVQNEFSVRLSSPHLIFPQIHTNTPTHKTHKNIHIDKSTQKYTDTTTQTNQKRDRSELVLVACGLVD